MHIDAAASRPCMAKDRALLIHTSQKRIRRHTSADLRAHRGAFDLVRDLLVDMQHDLEEVFDLRTMAVNELVQVNVPIVHL